MLLIHLKLLLESVLDGEDLLCCGTLVRRHTDHTSVKDPHGDKVIIWHSFLSKKKFESSTCMHALFQISLIQFSWLFMMVGWLWLFKSIIYTRRCPLPSSVVGPMKLPGWQGAEVINCSTIRKRLFHLVHSRSPLRKQKIHTLQRILGLTPVEHSGRI